MELVLSGDQYMYWTLGFFAIGGQNRFLTLAFSEIVLTARGSGSDRLETLFFSSRLLDSVLYVRVEMD